MAKKGSKKSKEVIAEQVMEQQVEDQEVLEEGINPEDISEEEAQSIIEENADTEDDTTKDTSEEGTPEDTSEPIEYPEVGTFKTKKELQKFYKKLTTTQLEEWAELEGVSGNIKPIDHPAIYRMRVAMEILYLHFPKEPTAKKSKYAKYSTEELVQMAMDNNVEVKDAKGDIRILRMYTIMALREAGLLA